MAKKPEQGIKAKTTQQIIESFPVTRNAVIRKHKFVGVAARPTPKAALRPKGL